MNISTSPPVSPNPHARFKAAFSHRQNIEGFIESAGVDHCALLTLVLPRSVRWKQAKERVERMQRALIDPIFARWLCVVEFHKDGRPHFHFVVASEENLRAGFDFEARDRAAVIERKARSLQRRMNADEKLEHQRCVIKSTANASALTSLWKHLRAKLPHHGFGRAHPGTLEPVKSAPHLATYLVKSFGADALPRPAEMKGARLVRYSRNQPRRANQRFGWTGARSRCQRRQIGRIAAALGVTDGQFASVYGRHWHYHCMNLVSCLIWDHGEAEAFWPAATIRKAAGQFLQPVYGPMILEASINAAEGLALPVQNHHPQETMN